MRRFIRFSAWSLHLLVAMLYMFSLWVLLENRTNDTFWSYAEMYQIVWRSAFQAFVSALGSVFLGLWVARSFFYLSFKGKYLLHKWIEFAWALPSFVVIFAVIGVWGNNGWIAQMLQYLGISFDLSIYGLPGILLAHLFLNVPLVMKYCLEGLSLIPSKSHQLASQLNLVGWRYFQIVELPVLKGILPYAFGTVFLLCFTSFPIVLILGGGPKYSTLEVAIYQAVAFEFDFTKAVMLIGVQISISIILQFIMGVISSKAFEQRNKKVVVDYIWRQPLSKLSKWCAITILSITIVLIILPIMNVIWNGLNALNIARVLNETLWQAIFYSGIIGLMSAIFVIVIAYLLCLETRRLAYTKQTIKQHILAGVVLYPLMFPIFLLAIGLFLLLMDSELTQWHLLILVGLCNGLIMLPFIYHMLFSVMWQSLVSHFKLGESLGLKGIIGWWIMEWKGLKLPLIRAFLLAISASLGNFSVIAFFGNPDFITLPYLLYQQLGSYRTEDAALTALILMILALLPLVFVKQKENW